MPYLNDIEDPKINFIDSTVVLTESDQTASLPLTDLTVRFQKINTYFNMLQLTNNNNIPVANASTTSSFGVVLVSANNINAEYILFTKTDEFY